MTHSKSPARRRLTRSARAVRAFLQDLATHGPFCGSAVTAILHWILAAATAAAVLASALLLSVVSMLPSAGVAQAAPCFWQREAQKSSEAGSMPFVSAVRSFLVPSHESRPPPACDFANLNKLQVRFSRSAPDSSGDF